MLSAGEKFNSLLALTTFGTSNSKIFTRCPRAGGAGSTIVIML